LDERSAVDSAVRYYDRLIRGLDRGDRHGPIVTVSFAQSLDGSVSMERTRPLRLSGDLSMVFTHELRARNDAILVGIGTVLSDAPRLTTRHARGADPRPVVVDRDLETPEDVSFLSPERRPILLHTRDADRTRRDTLEERGAECVPIALNHEGRLDLGAALVELDARGVSRLMVEGGGAVIASCIEERLVDVLAVTVAPTILGGYSPPYRSPRFSLSEYRDFRLGDDLVLIGVAA
jgi:3,4-dihydroxy 2-butanone 4-phosphate synthase/GTP cyclohydrolase II